MSQQKCNLCTKGIMSKMTSFSQPGPSCSKLTVSLVNDSLKFQMAILLIHYAKDSHIFYKK